MDPPENSPLHAWRLETRRDANGDHHHQSSSGPECWRPVRRLGNGTFGDVWLEHCQSGPARNELRALKHIRKRHADLSKASQRELEALVTFSDVRAPEYRHHFVRCLGWFDDAQHLYIAMEFVQCGDLQQYISQRPFPEPEAASITAQVAQALQYMHLQNFVHRDLKPLNILVSRPGPDWHVKLADFGLAKNTEDTALRTHNVGTQKYMAPELFDDSPDDYTSAVDVWALGAVAFCMRTGSPPFRSSKHLFEYVHDRARFPTRELGTSSGFCLDFVMGALAEAPGRRWTIEQVLEHDWLCMNSRSQGSEAYGADGSLATYSNPWDMTTPNDWASTYAYGTLPHRPQPGLPMYTSTQSQSTSWGPQPPSTSSSSQGQTWGRTTTRDPLGRYPQATGSAPPPGNRTPSQVYSPSAGSRTPSQVYPLSEGTAVPSSLVPGVPRASTMGSNAPSWQGPGAGTWASRYDTARSVPPAVQPAARRYSAYVPQSSTTAQPGQSQSSHSGGTAIPLANSVQGENEMRHSFSSFKEPAPPVPPKTTIGQPGHKETSIGSISQAQKPTPHGNMFPHEPRTEEYSEPVQQQHSPYYPHPESSRSQLARETGGGTHHSKSEHNGSQGVSNTRDIDAPVSETTRGRYDIQAPVEEATRGHYSETPAAAPTSSHFNTDVPAKDATSGQYFADAPAADATRGYYYDNAPAADATRGHSFVETPAADSTSGHYFVDPPAVEATSGQHNVDPSAAEATGGHYEGDPPAVETTSRHYDVETPAAETTSGPYDVDAPAAEITSGHYNVNAPAENLATTGHYDNNASVAEATRDHYEIDDPAVDDTGIHYDEEDRASEFRGCDEFDGYGSGGTDAYFDDGDSVRGATSDHYDAEEEEQEHEAVPETEESPQTDPFLTCTCEKTFNERQYLLDHAAARGHAPQIDSYLTCLTCYEYFSKRSDLFNHISELGHGRNTITNRPRKYSRPRASRRRDAERQQSEEPEMDDPFSDPQDTRPESSQGGDDQEEELDELEKGILKYARYTCLTCHRHFDNRSELFIHIDVAAHAQDPLTGECEHYTRPESCRQRDREYYKEEEDEAYAYYDARYTCLTCREHFDNRSQLFIHIDTYGHARDPYTKQPERYRRPQSCRQRDFEYHRNHEQDAEAEGYVNPRYTCLTCGQHFVNRSNLFEHLQRMGHARDLYTKQPEHYTRPAASRRIDFGVHEDSGYGSLRGPERLAKPESSWSKPRWLPVKRLGHKIRRSIVGMGI